MKSKILDWLVTLEQFKVWGIGTKTSTEYKKGMNLEGYTHRSQLDCEIVMEWDCSTMNESVKYAKDVAYYCRQNNIPVSSYSSGNRSIHMMIYTKPVVNREKFIIWLFRKVFENPYTHYFYHLDPAFQKKSHPLKLVGYLHDKTGMPYRCLRFLPKLFVLTPEQLEAVNSIPDTEDNSIHVSMKEYEPVDNSWIEKMARNGLKDGIRRFIAWVYVPYLFKKGWNKNEVKSAVFDFLDRCSEKCTERYVNAIINHREKANWYPMSRDKFIKLLK